VIRTGVLLFCACAAILRPVGAAEPARMSPNPAVVDSAEAPLSELRLRLLLSGSGQEGATVLLDPTEAYVGLTDSPESEAAAARLAARLLEALPAGVSRIWLSWPGAQGGGARLFERGAPARTLAQDILAALKGGEIRRIHLGADGHLEVVPTEDRIEGQGGEIMPGDGRASMSARSRDPGP